MGEGTSSHGRSLGASSSEIPTLQDVRMAKVPEFLKNHVTLEVDCVDRLPQWAYPDLANASASGVLPPPSSRARDSIVQVTGEHLAGLSTAGQIMSASSGGRR